MSAALLLGVLLTATPAAPPPLEGWHSDPAKALAEADETDRFVLVDLYAEWCGWCKTLEEEVFSSAAFGELAEDLVLLRVDVEDGGAGTALQAAYQVRSLPTTLLLDPSGALAGTVEGYAPAPRYLASIREKLAGWESLLATADRLLSGDDVEQMRLLADRLYERQEGERAAALYERMLELRGDSSALARIQYRAADAHRLARNWEAARTLLEAARRSAAEGSSLEEDLDLLAFQIARDRKQCAEAKASLERFLRDHPASERAATAERTLSLLQAGDGQICA